MRAWIIFAATGAALLGTAAQPALANDGTGKGHPPIALGSSGPEQPSLQQIGRVTSVDPAAMTFACHWASGDWTYHVTEKTAFRRDGKAATMNDLKTGDVVQVLFHMEGTNEVADAVGISTQ